MSSAASPAPKLGLFQTIRRVIDWRLVAAIGLPLWAFLMGVVVTHKPAPAAPPPVEVAAGSPTEPVLPAKPQAAEGVDPVPMPREVVVRTEFQPLVLPVLVPGEPVVVTVPGEPVEFKLPPSEVIPADRCKTFDTKIRFHDGLPEAAAEAKQSKKLLLVLHISGNFDDPGFT